MGYTSPSVGSSRARAEKNTENKFTQILTSYWVLTFFFFFSLKSIYGLTETTAIVNQSLRDETHELTDTTVGYISDHIEIKVSKKSLLKNLNN